MRKKSTLAVAALLTVLVATVSAITHTKELADSNVVEYDSNTGFVIAPGYKIVTAHCIACHSARLVTQQGQSRSGWKEIIEWMQEEQGLWPIPQDQLEIILIYLSTHYGEDRANFKENK